ncbi:MAG TPA: hypothetical protein VI434_13445 [Candidatus Dormibacteraeota bacterium]
MNGLLLTSRVVPSTVMVAGTTGALWPYPGFHVMIKLPPWAVPGTAQLVFHATPVPHA